MGTVCAGRVKLYAKRRGKIFGGGLRAGQAHHEIEVGNCGKGGVAGAAARLILRV